MKNKKTLLVSLLFLTTMTTPIITSSLTYASNNTNPVSANSNKVMASGTKKYSYTANSGYSEVAEKESKGTNAVSASFYTKEGVLFVAAATTTKTTNDDAGIFYSTDNGITFTYVTQSKEQVAGIVNTFAQTSDGNVWLGSSEGLSKMTQDKTTKVWSIIQVAVGPSGLRSNVTNIFENGTKIYLLLKGGTDFNPAGLYSNVDLNSIVFTRITLTGIAGLPQFTCITKDSENHFWIGTTKGLWANLTATTPEGTYTIIRDTGINLTPTSSILNIYLGSNKALYISDANNIYKATPAPERAATWTYSRFLEVSSSTLNSGKTPTSIFEDKSNNLWIGTKDSSISSLSATVLYYGSINSETFDNANLIDVPFGGTGISGISESKQDQFFIGILDNNGIKNSLINATVAIPNPNSGTGLSGGAIAGIVIGIIAASAIIGSVSFYVYKNKTKKPAVKTKK